MNTKINTSSPFMVQDWNGSVVSTHRSYEAAVAKAESVTEAAGSCIAAEVKVRKAWADAQRAKGNRRAVADMVALCADPNAYGYAE